jgi:hypothetical protein
MYAGFTLLLYPMILAALPLSLTLSNTPQTFDFEGDLASFSEMSGSPEKVTSPVASGNEAIECQNREYIYWNLATPSKTIDLTFKIYWTKLPTVANESLFFGQILGLDKETWQDILSANLYCDQKGYRGWNLWTDIPKGRGDFVSGDVVYGLETNHWYSIRMTADLNTGTYKLYMDENELASITDATVPANVYIDFFRLGAGVKGQSIFTTYYDDITVSLLAPQPLPNQWTARITSSSGGSTNPYETTNVNGDESLTVNATKANGYTFSKWTLDGTDYSTNSTVTIPPQPAGTQHTLHATFTRTTPEPNTENKWLPLQAIGLVTAGAGGYVLWPKKKQEAPQQNDVENTTHR